jgi:hypothetical protein
MIEEPSSKKDIPLSIIAFVTEGGKVLERRCRVCSVSSSPSLPCSTGDQYQCTSEDVEKLKRQLSQKEREIQELRDWIARLNQLKKEKELNKSEPKTETEENHQLHNNNNDADDNERKMISAQESFLDNNFHLNCNENGGTEMNEKLSRDEEKVKKRKEKKKTKKEKKKIQQLASDSAA